jgi:hypothetical protein
MPIKSKAQWNLMQAAAHSPEFSKKVGILKKVAKEMISKTKKMPKLKKVKPKAKSKKRAKKKGK